MRKWSYWMRGRFLVPAVAVMALAGLTACSGSSNKPAATATTSAATASSGATSGSSGASTASGSSSGAEASGSSGSAAALTLSMGNGPLGNYLTGPDGKTLYVFLKDAPNTSNCTGACLQTWPP
ncbi:MAG TPA: hypothetical protein VFY10_07230, partial [Dehalococcoidia bacterium]|nr:hypothetical protein [Dehalococcoidia bacterium]